MYKKLSNLENVYILEGNSYMEYLETRIEFTKFLKKNNKKLDKEMPLKCIVIIKNARESK